MFSDPPGYPTQFASLFFSDNPDILFNKHHLHALFKVLLTNYIKISNLIHKVLKNHTWLALILYLVDLMNIFLLLFITLNKFFDNITKFSMRLLILTFNVIGEGVLVAFLYLFVSRFVLRLEVRIKLFLTCCHARMHGLMHDGRLRACPSYLLGLLYGCKVMNVLK
jgi:hypothetical protein